MFCFYIHRIVLFYAIWPYGHKNEIKVYCLLVNHITARGINATGDAGDASLAITGQLGMQYLISPKFHLYPEALQKYLCIAMGQLVGCIHSSCNVLSSTINRLK